MKQTKLDKQIVSICCNYSTHYEKGSYMGSGTHVCNSCRKTCHTKEIEVKKTYYTQGGYGLLDTET